MRTPNIEHPTPNIEGKPKEGKPLGIPDRFQLLVTCRDEADQRRLYEKLLRQGYRIRVLVL
jgi:hypothetical protein